MKTLSFAEFVKRYFPVPWPWKSVPVMEISPTVWADIAALPEIPFHNAPKEPPAAPIIAPFSISLVRITGDQWAQSESAFWNIPFPLICAECHRKHFVPLHIRQHFFSDHRPPGGRLIVLCATCRPDFTPAAVSCAFSGGK